MLGTLRRVSKFPPEHPDLAQIVVEGKKTAGSTPSKLDGLDLAARLQAASDTHDNIDYLLSFIILTPMYPAVS